MWYLGQMPSFYFVFLMPIPNNLCELWDWVVCHQFLLHTGFPSISSKSGLDGFPPFRPWQRPSFFSQSRAIPVRTRLHLPVTNLSGIHCSWPVSSTQSINSWWLYSPSPLKLGQSSEEVSFLQSFSKNGIWNVSSEVLCIPSGFQWFLKSTSSCCWYPREGCRWALKLSTL